MTWHEAKAFCERLGGHLATITSAREQQFVQNLIKDGSKNQYWLGATDEVREGDWRWVTGEGWGYTNWLVGEPANTGGIEHYLQIIRSVDGLNFGVWNDIMVNNNPPWNTFSLWLPSSIGLICEWDSRR